MFYSCPLARKQKCKCKTNILAITCMNKYIFRKLILSATLSISKNEGGKVTTTYS